MGIPTKIGIVGIGYVGLPLAVCFAKDLEVVAFDVNEQRVKELESGFDRTGEIESSELKSPNLKYTAKVTDLEGLSVIIVTVPTPVDRFNVPDLGPLNSACDTIACVMSKGCTVVFESTVYPGLTEQLLAPRLEKLTGLRFNKDFYLGYSPERVNPGDKEHTIPKIKKIVAGSTPETGELLAQLYGKIVKAGIHRAPNIATAEAAKVIENIQRDVNIGLINELNVLFDRLGLDIHEVLEASGTKWNFLPFKPGLVGGHCIGVDPFYLTHKAIEVGFHPEVILAGRRINDSMADFYAKKTLREMMHRQVNPINANLLVLGFTFKENCPDVRNTKVNDLVKSIKGYGLKVDIFDPVADASIASHEYGVEILSALPKKKYNAVILAVPHREILALAKDGFETFLADSAFVYDIKGVLKRNQNVIH